MPFDGSGNYVPPGSPNFPAVAGTTIVSTYYNAVINDIVTALNNCLTRDGQGRPSATISWNNQSLGGVLNLTAVNLTASTRVTTANLTVTANSTFGGTVAVTGAVTLTVPLGAASGGLGLDGHLAANGAIPIGNGAGFTLATLTAGAGITITNGAGTITIAASGGGASGTTSFALTADASGAGVAPGGTFNGSAAVKISYNSVGAKPALVQNRNITSTPTLTPTFADDQISITAQAAALTLANPTGTANNGWGIVIRIKDNGTPQTITYGTQYRAMGTTLPTVTVANKILYIGMIYNATDTTWDVVTVIQQA